MAAKSLRTIKNMLSQRKSPRNGGKVPRGFHKQEDFCEGIDYDPFIYSSVFFRFCKDNSAVDITAFDRLIFTCDQNHTARFDI